MDESTLETEEEDLESVLKEMYDNFVPEKQMRTPSRKEQPIKIDTPTRDKAQSSSIAVYLAKISTSVLKSKDLTKALEKQKVARIQYLPTENSDISDAVIVAVTPLAGGLKIGKSEIPVTNIEEMTEEQRRVFQNIIE